MELEVRDELENLLDHEELLWKQKARCDWLQFGDHNTKFFHSRTIQRRKGNRIHALKIDGDWCSDQILLQDEAVQFYETLYGERSNLIRGFPTNLFPSFSA